MMPTKKLILLFAAIAFVSQKVSAELPDFDKANQLHKGKTQSFRTSDATTSSATEERTPSVPHVVYRPRARLPGKTTSSSSDELTRIRDWESHSEHETSDDLALKARTPLPGSSTSNDQASQSLSQKVRNKVNMKLVQWAIESKSVEDAKEGLESMNLSHEIKNEFLDKYKSLIIFDKDLRTKIQELGFPVDTDKAFEVLSPTVDVNSPLENALIQYYITLNYERYHGKK